MNPDAIHTTGRVPHGGEPDRNLLDFSANTNPNTPSGVTEVYKSALEAARRYPADSYQAFREAAADYVGCTPAQVVPTPGGLAALRLSLEVTLEPSDFALVPYPSFGEYAREVRLQGAEPIFIHQSALLEASNRILEQCTLAVVCTPNNPTGALASPAALEAFATRCQETETTLLVDEAFLGYTETPSAATFGHENVIVARSLTKLFGLPGIRAGFAVAQGDRLAALHTARRAWALSTPAAHVGTYCLRQTDFIIETRTQVATERARMRARLEAHGFEVSPSAAPYLLCAVPDADAVIDRTRKHGIAIRDARTFRGLDSHVRLAIKDRQSNNHLLEALTDD